MPMYCVEAVLSHADDAVAGNAGSRRGLLHIFKRRAQPFGFSALSPTMLFHAQQLIPRPAALRRLFSTDADRATHAYAATLGHLRIGRHTRVLFQGFTGRQATANAQASLAWGTQIVGGVTPGRSGTHLGLPLLPSVRAAAAALRPDATAVFVPAALAPAAIEEAIAAEVPLVVAVAEHIPVHAMLRLHAVLRTQAATRLVGANSPGIVSAAGRCRIGFQPLACFAPGRVGLAARSGTLSYEAAASTTRAGLGQSLCIGVGGDVLAGTDLCEALAVLAADDGTDAIALIGELGGDSELRAAAWIAAYRRRARQPKPIVALVAGTHAPPGRVMGHAGAVTLPGEPTPQEKVAALERAGATLVDHPEQFGAALRARLGGGSTAQVRGLHTSTRRRPQGSRSRSGGARAQTRSLFLGPAASLDVLRRHGVNTAPEDAGHGAPPRYLAVTIDRAARAACVLAAPAVGAGGAASLSLAGAPLRRFVLDDRAGVDGLLAGRVAAHLQLGAAAEALRGVLRALHAVFCAQQAVLVEAAVVPRLGGVDVVQARVCLDDAALAAETGPSSAGPDAETRRLAAAVLATEDAAATAARQAGIAYVALDPEDRRGGRIGTLVNGAGLAMNTVDALAARHGGGAAANFLDTGGQATRETVRACFGVLLRDPRVRVILVNVFGGLTRGDMIAEGVLLAFRETQVAVPVVVRIRGTHEAEGQALIRASGLPLFACDSFEEAAAKALELAARET